LKSIHFDTAKTMNFKHELRKILWKSGYDLVKISPQTHMFARKKKIFSVYKIDTVIDIGANAGQFAQHVRREVGFEGLILSFEPLSTAFKLLNANADNDCFWKVFNYALGDVEGKHEINIAANSYSSSILDMLSPHLKSAPDSKYLGKETIQIKTLDSVFKPLCENARNIYLKIDTQGFEKRVLRGAEKSLAYIDTVQIEMSLVPLYDGEPVVNEILQIMTQNGYTLIGVEQGLSDPNGAQLLQMDGFFHRFKSL
jgi:FkbM family methyltransferase